MNWKALPDLPTADRRLRHALEQHSIRAFLFVIGQNADSPEGQRLLQSWRSSGHTIGNHTYSHRNLHSLAPNEFTADVTRAEAVLGTPRPQWFRFPALKEGKTRAVRDSMRDWLREHGYRNGHVTIDASDWYYDLRLRERLKKDPDFDPERFRAPYLAHLWDRAQYYDRLSQLVLGRSVPHTILLHYNLINSLFLGDVCAQFQQKGWGLIDAADAYRDPVFSKQPNIAPAGESLLWALAKETGRYEHMLRYPGEDDQYEKPVLDRLGL